MSVSQLASHLQECRRRLSDLHARLDYVALTCAILRLEGAGGTVLYDQPFSRILAGRAFHDRLTISHGETFAIAFYPVTDGTQADRIPAALAPVEAITGEVHPLLTELPKPVRERLQLPDGDSWWRIVFHLAWHFPRPFLKATRRRLLSKDGAPAGISDETFVQLHGMGGKSDLLPGLVYSALEHNLCTCSEAALTVILDGLEKHAQAGTPAGLEAPALPAEQRRAIDHLRADFEAGAQMPMGLECKLLKLANSFGSPPATEWAGLKVGGCVERFLTLSKRNDHQEIVHIRGPATEWFCQVAERAGNALPACIPDCPILFDDIRRNESGIPIGMKGPSPVTNRNALERWVGFVFATLKQHEHEALQVRWGTPKGPLSYGLATLDRDLCAASVLAIDLARLTTALAPIPTDAALLSGRDKADPGSQIVTLRDAAAREYSASRGTFWLAAFPADLRVDRCDEHDSTCGTVADGRIALPWGGMHFLGTVDMGEHGASALLAFSLLHRSTEEVERFLSFAATAGAALVAHPPTWARSMRRAGGPATTWVAGLLFLAPAAAECVVEKPGGCRLIIQPWAASLATLRDWDSRPRGPEDAAHSPKNGLEGAAIGFLGGAALADALGVHASQREAFFKRLERRRISLGDECWQEVANPRPNSPRFLYRADSAKVRALAATYQTPKPA
jgi:hypothetical protein